MGWFNGTEGLAIWLEAIALVLIFIWDRLDSHSDHKQTIAQIKIAQEQAVTLQAMAQSTVNAERAWVLGYLGGYAATGNMLVLEGTSTTQGEHSVPTSAHVMLTCKNEDRTPAWIDSIYAHMEIIAKHSDVVGPGNRKGGRTFGVMGPLGAEKQGMRLLELACLGHRKENEVLSIYVLRQFQKQRLQIRFANQPSATRSPNTFRNRLRHEGNADWSTGVVADRHRSSKHVRGVQLSSTFAPIS